jgi:zinc/manganese transport system permease protein
VTGLLGPFDALSAMMSHDFVRHALLAGSGIAVAAGLVGYFVVLRNQVFAGESLGHVAFTGALASFAVGVDPRLGLFSSTVAGSVGIGALGGRARGRDVVVGTVFAWVLGLGVLFLSLYTTSRSTANGAAGVNILFGSIYGLSQAQAEVAAAIGLGAAVCLLAMARPLLFSSVDPDVAAARGLPVRSLGIAFLVLLGVVVGEAVQAVGALLIAGLMVTPAATAHRLIARPHVAMLLSAALGLAYLWVGISIAYAIPKLPPSFVVIAVAFVVYLPTALSTRRH